MEEKTDLTSPSSEKTQQLAQAWLHGVRRWIEAGAGGDFSVYQGAPEQNLPWVCIILNYHKNLNLVIWTVQIIFWTLVKCLSKYLLD